MDHTNPPKGLITATVNAKACSAQEQRVVSIMVNMSTVSLLSGTVPKD